MLWQSWEFHFNYGFRVTRIKITNLLSRPEKVSEAASAVWETAKQGVHEAAQEPAEKYELPPKDAPEVDPKEKDKVKEAATAVWETAKQGVHEAAQEPAEKYELPPKDAAGEEPSKDDKK